MTVVGDQHTMKQSRIDLANTHEYRWAHVLGQLAAVEGWARTLALENAKNLQHPRVEVRVIQGGLTAIMHKRRSEPWCQS